MVALDDRDRPAGPQHPPQRDEGLLRAREVLEQEEHDDVVDGPGRHRRVVRRRRRARRPGRRARRPRHGRGRRRPGLGEVDRGEAGAGAARGEHDGLRADPAAGLEDVGAVGERDAVVQEVGEGGGLVAQPRRLGLVVAVDVGPDHGHLPEHGGQDVVAGVREDLGEAVAHRAAPAQVGVHPREVGAQRRGRIGVGAVEQRRDPVEREPQRAQGDRPVEADDVVGAVEAVARGGARRRDDAALVPVAQHPHRQAGGLGELADRPPARHGRNARTSHRERSKRQLEIDDEPIVNLRWTHGTDSRPARPPRRPHQRDHLGPLRRPRAAAGRRARRRAPRRGRRPPHRPLRRPRPTLRGVVDRHRQAHGRHEAGRPEAVRAEGLGGEIDSEEGFGRFTPRARNVVVEGAGGGPVGGERRDHAGAPRARAAPRARVARGADDRRRSASRRRRCAARCSAPCRPGPTRSARSSRSTRAAKKVLELTFRQALRLGHNYVGTEHILLALLEHEDGAGTLTGLGLDREAVEGHVVRMLSSLSGAPEDPGRLRPRRSASASRGPPPAARAPSSRRTRPSRRASRRRR